MSSSCRVSLALAISLSMLAGAQLALAAPAAPEQQLMDAVKNGPHQKIGPWLANLYEEYQRARDKSAFRTRNPVLRVQAGKVGVDLYASDAVRLRQDLRRLGATNVRSVGALLSAQVPVRALGELAALASLEFASPAIARTRLASQGSVVSQGDVSLNADDVRAGTGLDGNGITVGLLSDTYECNPPPFNPGQPTSTAAQDVITQDVPPEGVEVLDNGPCDGAIDEGRAMAQLVHDVAPGASLQFHTAFNSLVDFGLGILELEQAGSDVIVDDVIYLAENMFSDGIVAQAADLAVAAGAAFFSSAGNNARLSYEAPYRETLVGTSGGANLNGQGAPFVLRTHDFDGGAGTDTLQKIQVTQAGGQAAIVFSFQWDQPFLSSTAFAQETDPNGQPPRGATGDLDLLIYDSKGVLVPLCPPGLAVGITCQITGDRNIGRDAVDLAALFVTGPKDKSGEYYLRLVRAGGDAPRHVKYVAFEFAGTVDIVEHDTASGTNYGHANAAGAAGIGASSWYLTEEFDAHFSSLVQDAPGACVPACLNDFSSAGGVPIHLDKYGNPLASAEVRRQPVVTGPDGGNTTFFLADSNFDDDDGDGCNSPFATFITPCLDDPADETPNFFGTSASAPHVAAVAALMLEKNAALAPAQVYQILRDTAEDITRRQVVVVPGPGESVFSPLPAGFDHDSGDGFVDAAAALAATPAP